MWERYCRGVQAIVFVVDSADLDSLEAAKEELHTLLAKPSLVGGGRCLLHGNLGLGAWAPAVPLPGPLSLNHSP